MDKTSKEIWADYRNGRKFYLDSIELAKTPNKGECPYCHKIVHITKYNHVMRDFETDEIIDGEDSYIDYWCDLGCDLSNMDFYKPYLDKAALKRAIMASRARFRDDSLEVFNKSDNPHLEGYNCLYIQYTPLTLDSGWWVYYDYYLEYAHNGRNANVGKKGAIMQKKKPTSKEAKELLYAWMIERFEAMTGK